MDVNQSSPWNVEVITPSNLLIEKFEKWDKTKSSAHKLRSYNRARKWVSDLLKRPLKIPETYKLRNVDILKALEDMTDSMAMPGGLTYNEYLISCLAPLPKQDLEFEEFQDAVDETDIENSESKNHATPVNEEKKPFKCEICDTVFAKDFDMDSHFATVHEGKKPYKCEAGKSSALDSHISAVHEEKMPFKCDTCDKEFTKNCELKIHVTTVHEERKLSTRPNPICKSIWLGIDCQTTNCPKAHPKRCENPNCLVLDQGLPRWRILQCRNWHGRLKERIKNNMPPNSRAITKTGRSKPQWRPLSVSKDTTIFHTSSMPVWKVQQQNNWFKANPIQTFSYSYCDKSLGNDLAAWGTPLPMCSSQMWGQKLNLAYWKFRN